jgi:hypothetical protein
MVVYLYQLQCEYRLAQLKAFWKGGNILGTRRREDKRICVDGLHRKRKQSWEQLKIICSNGQPISGFKRRRPILQRHQNVRGGRQFDYRLFLVDTV